MALGARLRALLSRRSEPRTVISMHRERQVAVLSILVVLLVGLPLWWTTTRVYRADLPAAEVRRLAPARPLRLPLVFHVDAGALEARQIEQSARALVDAQRAPLAPGEWRVHYQVAVRPGPAPDAPGHYTLRLGAPAASAGRGIEVDPGRSATVLAPRAAAPDALSEAIAEIVAAEERAAHGAHSALKYAPEYAITLTLLNEDPVDGAAVDWDIEQALDAYLRPLARKMQPLTRLSLSSQVLHHAGPPPVAPLKTANGTRLTREMLPHFVNSPSWNFASVDPTSPMLNFVLFVPALAAQPMRIAGKPRAEAFLVSQWGGVSIANLPAGTLPGAKVVLSREDLQRHMGYFVAQLRTLIGIRSDVPLPQRAAGARPWVRVRQATDTGVSDWELDALLRQWLVHNRQTAITTLQSLVRLVESLPNMVVMDEIKTQVDQSLRALHAVDAALGRADYLGAFSSAAAASTLAEAAFFDPTMVSMLYFPDQHKLAIYMPYFLPVALPVLAAVKKIIAQWRRRKPAAAAAAAAPQESKKTN
ncbi:GPI transamidase component [Coemansia javaensis]|uniref:GPI transamidase component n=1 Tax=Coemansia javaensis TaxID=2761396 RepID=A0A9W8H6U6_9FUNG|nr:GPI transamidase component [Coemansia javaensis]